MGKKVQCWIDESLERELRRIQEKMKSEIGDVDLSRPQASIIAAKQLRENPPNITAEIVRSKRGKRVSGISFL